MNYYMIETENTDFTSYFMSWHHFTLLSDMFIGIIYVDLFFGYFSSYQQKILKGIWCYKKYFPNCFKLNNQKTEIMASGPITSWEIDGETVETVSDFFLRGLQNHCRWWLQPWN